MKTTTVAAAAAIFGSASAQDWESWSNSTTPSVETSTTSADPSTWSEWSTTSSTPAVKTSTTSEDPSSWTAWQTTSSSPAVKTSTSTDPSHTWSEWDSKTSSTPAVKTSTDPATWGSWDPTGTTTVTSTSTQWVTITVYPNDGGETWSAWSSAPATSTKTDSRTVVVSSTVTKTASASNSDPWSAWSSVATPVAAVDPNCKLQITVSYGAAIWYPTPAIATAANTTTWGEWDSWTSSTPAVKTSTSSSTTADPTSTHSWEEWSSTSSTPAIQISTSTDPVWGNWISSTSSTPAVRTSTTSADPSSWTAWVGSSSSTPSVKTSTDPISSWTAWESSSTPSVRTSTSASVSSATTWAEQSQSTNGITANGNKFGMTYSPYTAGGACKDQSTVTTDIAALAAKGFTSVRVYSTDCSTLEFVGAAAKQHGIKVILGVFISETGISGAQPQVDAIAKWAQWGLVELIVVGNEAVFQNRCSAKDLASFIGSAKATFKAAGYTGAVSTTDELSVWQGQGAAWCDVVDVVTANLYAFFNPNTKAEDAGTFIQAQINDLSKVCPGKEVYVMESGWPSAGQCNGVACPSPENQATAIKGIQAAVGGKIVFFSFEDEAWKQPGQFGVEQHWGCGEVFN